MFRRNTLSFDLKRCIGLQGRPFGDSVARARERLLAQEAAGELGWMTAPSDRDMRKRVRSAVRRLPSVETLVVLGIGGSDLGARAVLQALPQKRHVVFAGDTTDPVALEDALAGVDWKRAAVNVISKSGGTVETLAAFAVARERLVRAVGKQEARHRIVVTTDAKKGALRDLAEEEGLASLPVAQNIGGRFSVLSDVGLFPLAWAGVNIEQLLAGASEVMRAWDTGDALAAQMAALYADAYRHGLTQWVFMTYARRLTGVAAWTRQLIAESLGKKVTRAGKVVHRGPTPIVAEGPTDQHSQLQLYREGPKDKFFLFLDVAHRRIDVRVPRLPDALRGTHLEGVSLAALVAAEREATAASLAAAKRPNATLLLDRLDERSLGALLQTFMLSVAILGELFDVDAFNQPGVEDSKRRIRAWLER